MKNISFSLVLIFSTSIILFTGCKKSIETVDVRYEFTSTTSANYHFNYLQENGIQASESVTGTTWTKNVKITLAGGTAPSFASVTVYPPAAWSGTSNNATIVLKIFVNNEQKTNDSHVLTAADMAIGFRSLASF